MLLFWVSTKTNENLSTTKRRYYEIENTLLSKKMPSLSYFLLSTLHLSITSKLQFFFSVAKSPCTFNQNHIVETWIPWDITASIHDIKCPLHLQCSTGTYLKVGLKGRLNNLLHICYKIWQREEPTQDHKISASYHNTCVKQITNF